MKHPLFIYFIVTVLLTGIQYAEADDPSCVRIPCLGQCISKEEAAGKVTPMLCMQAYTCYNNVECTRLDDGKCGWKETPELKDCLAAKSKPFIVPGASQQ